MAPQVGLEPTTVRLTAECSTTELLRNNISLRMHLLMILNELEYQASHAYQNYSLFKWFIANTKLERVKRIELSSSAWKAEVLPLNYTRISKYWRRQPDLNR